MQCTFSLNTSVAFSRYSSVACLVKFGLVLVVREPEINARQMSENIVHTVQEPQQINFRNTEKQEQGKEKGRGKIPQMSYWFIFLSH